MRWRAVCRLACRLPEVEEGVSYGARALRVRGSLVAQLSEDRRSIVVKAGVGERDALCRSSPATFAVVAGRETHSLMAVRLRSVNEAQLWPVLVDSWRRS